MTREAVARMGFEGAAPAAFGGGPGRRRRVALVIANLGWGGAQKVMVSLANAWAQRGWGVTLISLGAEPPLMYFPVHPEVAIVYLGVSRHSSHPLSAVVRNTGRFLALRRAIGESGAAVVVSFLSTTNIRTLIATLGLGRPVIVSERGDPQRDTLGPIWRWLRRLTYPLAFRLVAQTEPALGCFAGAVRRRGVVIPNPVEVPPAPVVTTARTIVAVGHLDPVKGFDLLLQAFARCAAAHPDWSLTIWGEGDHRRQLEEVARGLGIADRVAMPGRSDRPGGWVEDAGLYVLASRHEGFPNALAEAMAAGLPVIATDCPVGGPRTLVAHGQNGLLVAPENVEALAAALDGLMADPVRRRLLGEAAWASMGRFASPLVMARWTELVEEAAGHRLAAAPRWRRN